MGLFEERHESRMRDPQYAAAYAEADAELSLSETSSSQIAAVQFQELEERDESDTVLHPYAGGSPPAEEVLVDEPSYAFA